MKSSHSPKLSRQIIAHSVTLFIGILLTFGSFKAFRGFSSASIEESPNNNTVLSNPNNVTALSGDSFVAAAVAITGPAVVRIDTEQIVNRPINPFFGSPFSREELVTGQGSGFITDSNGIILTNAHVVKDASQVTVTLKDGRTFRGEVKGFDELTDLAVVKIEPDAEGLPVAPLGDSDQVQVGDWAIAVGNPVGLNNTVTLGIISTIDRSSAQAGAPDKRLDFLQTDAAINPGNSGGALLNAKGEVIGINTAIRPDAMGIGFAIPINLAKRVKDYLAQGESVPHPYIGISMTTLTPEVAQSFNQNPKISLKLPERNGILVTRVLPNTPAQKSGMKEGDVIIKVNEQNITRAEQLQSLVEKTEVGQELIVELIRQEKTMKLKIITEQLKM
jgi:S1-C subfamily serine protease